jgi:molybdopterin molybdotransferase
MKLIHLFDEARQAAMNRAIMQRTEAVNLSLAYGRYLAKPVIAKLDVPPFNRAMMDGFAIRSDDLSQNSGLLTVVDTVIAGDEPENEVKPGEAIRIMTGAPVPDGADAVVRFEWCEELPDNHVQILKQVRKGESIQPIGEDGKSGQTIIPCGARLTGAELAVCKTFGVHTPSVTIPPRVCILVTGNELVQNPETELRQGQIYGANEMFLQGALKEDGATVTRIRYIKDNLSEISAAISESVSESEYVILTGGVSAGDLDFVPAAIRQLSGELDVEKVLMRPGSPFVVSKIGSTAIFALSGNPAASFIQFESLVRPVIRKTLGMEDKGFPITGELLHGIHLKPIKHTRILRAVARIVAGRFTIDASMAQSPGVMSSFAVANCLVRLDESTYEAGSGLPVRLFKPPVCQS